MSRGDLDYRVRRDLVACDGFDPDTPVEGWYRIRLRKGAVYSAVRIWFGPPNDPVTGEVLDRGWRWQASINGDLVDLERVWPQVAKDPITQAEHDYLLRRQDWARQHDPDSAIANPTKPVDLLHAPLPF